MSGKKRPMLAITGDVEDRYRIPSVAGSKEE